MLSRRTLVLASKNIPNFLKTAELTYLGSCSLSFLSSSSLPSISTCLCLSVGRPKSRIEIGVTRARMSSSSTATGKPKIFVTRNDYPQVALDFLRDRCDVTLWDNPNPAPKDVILQGVRNVEGIYCCITDKINEEVLDAAGPQLKVVSTMSVGYDHIDAKTVKGKGIKIGFTPDVLTDATAELTVAILLAASRRLFESHQKIVTNEWGFWGPTWMCGQGLAGSTVGIFGLGRIGVAVMSRLAPFKVKKFIYSGRSKKTDITDAEFVDFDTLLRTSDFVVVTAPFTAETKEIFNERAFNLMKPNAIFVNSSRGGLVQQDDLVATLKARKIFAAALDVMSPEPLPSNHELLKLDNCVVIPHIGSATIQSRNDMAMLAATNLVAAINGEKMPAELTV